MEIVFQILKQLPSGWPRIAVLVGLGLLFFLPEMRRMLTWHVWTNERFELAKQLLELRQLEITVEELKAQHPESKNEVIDGRVRELLDVSPSESQLAEPIAWTDRLKYSLAGSFALMILGTIALWHSGKFVGENATQVILVELGYTAICGFLAAAIPARNRWESVFRGFLIPAFLGALMATAMGSQ